MTSIDFQRWPCLKEEGLRVFNTTADQRFLLGEELFLQTHYPITIKRHVSPNKFAVSSEQDLLEELGAGGRNTVGNRVFLLYGAAGAGKSELLRWLQTGIAKTYPERSPYMVRINRNELDVLSIVEKFRFLLSKRYFSENTHARWDEARRKPRTIAKLLLLSALEKSFDADDLINALYYRLLEWVQPRLQRALAQVSSEEAGTPIELFSREDLAELEQQTHLEFELKFEQFRYHLNQTFHDLLLEGSNLPETLKNISDDLVQQGVRPILLVDDLVQSLSIFSTDLLDYFTTLDEGNWDVVIGLTPDALSDNARGQNLLDRVSYLDTIDDRVSKMYLSDDRGNESYFLDIENCSEFISRYIRMFRLINGIKCQDCAFLLACQRLPGQETSYLTAPLNSLATRRIFRQLPEGKGRVRQLLRAVREVLNQVIATGQVAPVLSDWIQKDMAVECEHPDLSSLVEIYFPAVTEPSMLEVDVNFLATFNLPIPPTAVQVSCHPLQPKRWMEATPSFQSRWADDPASLAVKDWLDGKEVNRQSLGQLRRGTARWLRDAISICSFHTPGKAKPHKVLKWQGVYLDVRPPIFLRGVDEENEILLQREVGLLAFQLNEYALALGNHRRQLAGAIASDQRIVGVINGALAFQGSLWATLSSVLLGDPEIFAALVTSLFWHFGDLPAMAGIPAFHNLPVLQNEAWGINADIKLVELTRLLFEDFFILRENIYDAPRFLQIVQGWTLEELIGRILAIDEAQIPGEFFIGDLLLSDFVRRIKQRIHIWKNPLLSNDKRYAIGYLIDALAVAGEQGIPYNNIPADIWQALWDDRPDVYVHLRIFLSQPALQFR